MTAFTLPARFDVVICMFDTLNHVPSFDGWLSLFSCVHEHLAPGRAVHLRREHGRPAAAA